MASFSNVNVNFATFEVPKPLDNNSTAPTTATVSREMSPRDFAEKVASKLDLSTELKIHENVPVHNFDVTILHDTGAPDGFECFVGRMPIAITEDMMYEIAKDFNPTECRILNKTDRAQHLCGFVVFNQLEMAQGFISEFNGRTMVGCKYPLNVRFADGKNRKKIFIGGLATGAHEEDVRQLTQAYGTILCIKMLNKNPKCPCGFVSFATGEQADACIRYLHDTPKAVDSKNHVVKLARTPEVGDHNSGHGKGGNKRGRDEYSSDYGHHKRGRKGKGKGKGRGDNNNNQYNNFMAPTSVGYTPESHYSTPTTSPGFQYQSPQMHYGHQLVIPDGMCSTPVSQMTSAVCSPTSGAFQTQGFGMQPDVAQQLLCIS